MICKRLKRGFKVLTYERQLFFTNLKINFDHHPSCSDREKIRYVFIRVSSRELGRMSLDECLWIYNIDGTLIHGRDTFVSKLFIAKVRRIRVQISLRGALTFRSKVVYYFSLPRLS